MKVDFFPYLQIYLCGSTKLSSATNGDLMVMGASVELENLEICVLQLDHRPSTTEMTQMGAAVAVECSGLSCLPMLSLGFNEPRYVTAGTLMGMEVSVGEELLMNCVHPLEHLHKNTEMIRMGEGVGAKCHGGFPFLAIHPNG